MSDNKSFKVQNGLDVTGDANISGSVTATSFIGDGSQLTGISGGGSGGGLDSASALDLFSYGIDEVGSNEKQVAISLNTYVTPFNQTGNQERAFNLNYTSSTGMYIRETAGVTEIHADASGSTASTGLVLEGETSNNSGVELVGNVKLSSLPTSDPSEAGLLWNDGGIPVFSGSTAPTGGGSGGGLDSDAVQGVVDDNLLGGVSNTGVVIGPSASADATKLQMTVIGPSATTNGAYNVAIGRSASVQSGEENAVAIGNQARAGYSTGGGGGVSIGSQSTVQYDNGVAVGRNAEVKGARGIALGFDAEVRDADAIAIGYGPLVLNGQNSISVGRGIIDADNAISISATGAQTTLSGQYSIDIRTSAAGSLTYDTTNDWVFGSSVTLPGATISGHIIPDTNAQYDLGAAEYKFRHLYLSENSVHTPHGALSFVDGNLTFGGEPVMLLSDIQEVAAGCDTFEDFKAALASL